jgi:hypothetical protein
MSRPALEVADIFRDHGPAWRQANAGHVSLRQMKVMSAIEPLPHGGNRHQGPSIIPWQCRNSRHPNPLLRANQRRTHRVRD